MRYDQDSPAPTSEDPPTTDPAVGSNIEVIDMPELTPTVNRSRTSSRTTRPPARYDDFVRHDSKVTERRGAV